MGRTVRDAKLESRSARLRLPIRPEPHWRIISEGAHLGYYKGSRSAKWVARFRQPGGFTNGYLKATLGEADDFEEADGERFLNFSQAQERARAWFHLAATGGGGKKIFTVSDALGEYMESFRGKSVYATKSRINAVIRPELGTLEVRELTARQIANWHQSRAKAPARLRTSKKSEEPNIRPTEGLEGERRRRSTANRDLTVLKAALNRAADHRPELPVEAWRSVRPFQNVDRARLRYLTDDEARRLVNTSEGALRSLVQAALLTGARYGELCRLRVIDFNGDASVLLLPDTKSGKPRVVYLEEEGRRLIERCSAGKDPGQLVFEKADGKGWRPSQQQRPLSDACKRAKIEPAGFHDLRRTYGARLAIKGVPMAVIAEALGHADERITRRHYAHLSPSYVADTVRANVAGLGIVPADSVVKMAAKRGATSG